MGIDDDTFDVEAALEGKPEAEAFDRILERLARLERFEESATRAFVAIETGTFWQRMVDRGDWRTWKEEDHVGPEARVGGDAKVGGNAKVGVSAGVGCSVRVWGNAEVGGDVKVGGNAKVGVNAEVGPSAEVGYAVSLTDERQTQ